MKILLSQNSILLHNRGIVLKAAKYLRQQNMNINKIKN